MNTHRVKEEAFFELFLPVSQEGTDDVFGVSGDLHIIGKVEGVLVVHDLTVGPH